ncbi:MAG: subclass B1 metallo-beta-lactamase [Bacteroidales bacterium]|nr:subclass B1 metallo-beta-lactamase [Bacteroidales bacterium]
MSRFGIGFMMLLLLLLLLLLLSCGIFSSKLHAQEIIKINSDLELVHIKDSVFMHVNWIETKDYGTISCNGMLFVKNGKALMVDTPMTNKETKELYHYLTDSMNIEIEKLIVGHYHQDCLGGLEFLHSIGVISISGEFTKNKCMELDLPIPHQSFQKIYNFQHQGKNIICYYPGGGHTLDNIVVYLPSEKVLFGGCLIKSLEFNNLGYIGEAVMGEYEQSIQNVLKEFPNIEFVIPGHGKYGDTTLLMHTIDLVRKVIE